MSFAFVAAVGGVGFEDVAVAGFQFFQDTAFVDYTGAAVVGECAESLPYWEYNAQNLARSLRSNASACASVS